MKFDKVPIPSMGRLVYYALTSYDAGRIGNGNDAGDRVAALITSPEKADHPFATITLTIFPPNSEPKTVQATQLDTTDYQDALGYYQWPRNVFDPRKEKLIEDQTLKVEAAKQSASVSSPESVPTPKIETTTVKKPVEKQSA